MPELPEVETIRRQLEPLIVGKTISSIEVLNPGSFRADPGSLIGKTITNVGRKGKVLEIGTRDRKQNLYIHLKMSGQLRYRYFPAERDQASPDKISISSPPDNRHLRVVIKFSNGDCLEFHDQRKFGWIRVMNQISGIRNQIPELPKGMDALDTGLTAKKLKEILQSSNRPIKTILLDQSKIAGIGNIYASEILWYAKTNPATKGRTFCAQSGVMVEAIRKILNEAIKYGGSTMDDQLYRHVSGQAGDYWSRRRVYDREGEPCSRCQTPIKKGVIGQRSAYWCPKCQ